MATACVVVPASADPSVRIVQGTGGWVRVPDASGASTASAPISAKTPWRMVSVPGGVERVIDLKPSSASSSARLAHAAAPTFRSTFNNGVAELVAPGNAGAPPAAPRRAAFIEEALPNGGWQVSLPAVARVSRAVDAPVFPIIDIDAAGQTQRPADAARSDVLLRRIEGSVSTR